MPGIQPLPSSGSFHWDPQEKPFESWAMHFTSWGGGGTCHWTPPHITEPTLQAAGRASPQAGRAFLTPL